jgi:hypothetical protein
VTQIKTSRMLAAALATMAIVAAPASAAELTYIDNHNVYVENLDGSARHALSADGTPDRPYALPTADEEGNLAAFQANATTGQQGIAFFQDLAAGKDTVTEVPPDGMAVAVYVVGCSDASGSVPFTYDDSTGLRIILKLTAGQEVTCNWYNIPPAKGPSGSITVHKFLCQGRKDNAYNWEQDCENYGDGAEFELKTTDGKALTTRTTNLDGLAVFANLADGAYGLDETTGNWCHAEADLVDSSGNVLVRNGGNTDVFIYNCGQKKAVNKLPTTGAGPMAGPSGNAALFSVAGGLAGLILLAGLRRRGMAVGSRQ